MRSIRYAYLLFLIAFSHYACAQNPEYYKRNRRHQSKRLENNLTGWVKLDGAPGWNLQQRMKFHNVHGVSIAVIKDYKIHWVRGYGWADTSDKRPVTPSTLFQAASISKSLHAMGVLKLADKK
jgi:Beta-lactamase class C and other penicillin binding proteins